MSAASTSPSATAFHLTRLLDAAFGEDRFPVDVAELAKAVGKELRLDARIVEVQPAPNLQSFEGGLFHLDGKDWALIYNAALTSPGRIRFTLAHELAHFLLHRDLQAEFYCSQAEIAGYDVERRLVEGEADEFASVLLMPLRQFRVALSGQVFDLNVLSSVSSKFGVSLTSAALRWIRATDESAVLVLSRDGYIDWSVSSEKAAKNGAFFRTRGKVVPVPDASLAADKRRDSCRDGEIVPLSTWFEHGHPDALLREMKLTCDNYGYILTLLGLSGGDKVWAPRR